MCRTNFLKSLCLAVAIVFPGTSLACVSPYTAQLTEMHDGELIFSGELVDYQLVEYRDRNRTKHYAVMRFKVNQVLRGELGEEITLYQFIPRIYKDEDWRKSAHLIVSAKFFESTHKNIPDGIVTPSDMLEGEARWAYVQIVSCGNTMLFPTDPKVLELLEQLLQMERADAKVYYENALKQDENLRYLIFPVGLNMAVWDACLREKLGDCGGRPSRFEPLRNELMKRLELNSQRE